MTEGEVIETTKVTSKREKTQEGTSEGMKALRGRFFFLAFAYCFDLV